MDTTANDTQIGGDHYKGGEEHWDRVQRLGLDYFQACITKYVERCWRKNGVEDLKKAQHFIQKYIEISGDRLGAAQDFAYLTLTVGKELAKSVLESHSTEALIEELATRAGTDEARNMGAHAEELRRQQDEERRRKEELPHFGHGDESLIGTGESLEPADEPLLGDLYDRGPMCKECGAYADSAHATWCSRYV